MLMSSFAFGPVPATVGIGLRSSHHSNFVPNFLDSSAVSFPDLSWVEVHSENFFADGGDALHILDVIRQRYDISLHGVGMSLGSADGLNQEYLSKLRRLVQRVQPILVSDHVSWSRIGDFYSNDLLPLPYTRDAAATLINNIQQAQDFLGRQILIENPSSYLQWQHSDMNEHEFIIDVVKRAGCGLLLDVNNIYVSAMNHNFDAHAYIDAIAKSIRSQIQEIHLAGHSVNDLGEGKVIHIDHHGDVVCDAVWDLYGYTLASIGRPVATLIEWDTDVPELPVLLNEAQKARQVMTQVLQQNS